MISLLARDPISAFGLSAILDTEKIPYRRCERIDPENTGVWLVAGCDLEAGEIEQLRHLPCIVMHGGAAFAQAVLGAEEPATVTNPCAVPIDAAIWPVHVRQLAAAFRIRRLRLPVAPICATGAVERGRVLATFSGSERPAIVHADRLLWSAIDLGSTFTHLLGETYLPPGKQHAIPTAASHFLRRAVESLYYLAPEALRQRIQRASYARLLRQLNKLGDRATEYPVDATGWLVIQLVRQLLLLARGGLASLAHWPAPFHAAATLTHDIEPQPYAYTTGLNRLLDTTAEMQSPAAFGLVAKAAATHLTKSSVERLQNRTVLCHGMTHRGEIASGQAAVRDNIGGARSLLESHLGRSVYGYRSPRLDRSADLLAALDDLGFRYDSSYPDVDRENVRHFGGGVRVNLPFRPPLYDHSSRPRPSRCLELPLTAPDCIQPLYGGASSAELELTVQTKAAFVRESGGLYVALVHAGVFGDADAERRETHLRLVNDLLHHPDVWFADIGDIAAWWTAREQVRIETLPGALRIVNAGDASIDGLQVLIEYTGVRTLIVVPPLAAGAVHLIELAHASESQPAAAQYSLFSDEISTGTGDKGKEQSL
ncbi:MAG: polysaccharide deacetylase family protein [Deltaproteobacteria bacterium]|nr:polysaccharide deacetylase family protein [Deltaproteobacteria bacterium]